MGENHRHEINDQNLALPPLFVCGKDCLDIDRKIKDEYFKKASEEFRKIPKELGIAVDYWLKNFFFYLKIFALRAYYVSKETGVNICIGLIERASNRASRYSFFVVADASDLEDVKNSFRVLVYATEPYSAYEIYLGKWYLNKPKFGDPFWNLNEFIKYVHEPHSEEEYLDISIRKALRKIDRQTTLF